MLVFEQWLDVVGDLWRATGTFIASQPRGPMLVFAGVVLTSVVTWLTVRIRLRHDLKVKNADRRAVQLERWRSQRAAFYFELTDQLWSIYDVALALREPWERDAILRDDLPLKDNSQLAPLFHFSEHARAQGTGWDVSQGDLDLIPLTTAMKLGKLETSILILVEILGGRQHYRRRNPRLDGETKLRYRLVWYAENAWNWIQVQFYVGRIYHLPHKIIKGSSSRSGDRV